MSFESDDEPNATMAAAARTVMASAAARSLPQGGEDAALEGWPSDVGVCPLF